MHRVLLDTDVLSEIVKGKHVAVARRARAYRAAFGTFTISAVTVMEIVSGWRRKGDEPRLAKFVELFRTLEILDVDGNAAEIAGRVHGDLMRSGVPIGTADPMVAGIALAHGLPLVTGNVEHFERVVAHGYPLVVESWA